jgi:cyclophilin family peptidyl-prolyl cis-trans isomerase
MWMWIWTNTGRIVVLAVASVALVALALGGCDRYGAGRSGSFPAVDIVTSAGTIRAELWPDKAPNTVANFLQYADEGFYDNTIFHRCIVGFMIQGGGLTEDWKEKPAREPIRNEADSGLRNVRGTLAMARKPDPHSATCQFFINTADNPKLDHEDNTDSGWGYCVFGQVVSGMEVVDAIELAPTVGPEANGRPAKPVVIKSIRRVGGPRPAAGGAKAKAGSKG